MMGMFVQGALILVVEKCFTDLHSGFWFGSHLVKDGKIGPGDVMAVFWACLIATNNLQMCIPQFIVLAKGKFAMVSLLTLVDNDDDGFDDPSSSSRSLRKRTNRSLRKIRPARCAGEFALHNISFAYPSRPTVPVLQDVSLFLPAYETTFIVGSSGSGKSTIAHLLLGLYAPQAGAIQLDDQDVRYIDDAWRRAHVAGVEQGCILFDMSVFDNVALGAAGGRHVTREEVKQACISALMHEFVRDLPEGYDTMLGTNGASLSGGQKQRLAIARARLRDPTVLILGPFFRFFITSFLCLREDVQTKQPLPWTRRPASSSSRRSSAGAKTRPPSLSHTTSPKSARATLCTCSRTASSLSRGTATTSRQPLASSMP
jgi:ABC-type multidrug transport system fused ATPase/permease subunit